VRKYSATFSHRKKLSNPQNKKNTSFFIHFLSYLLNSSLTSPPFWRNLSRRATSALLHFGVFVSNVSSESERERGGFHDAAAAILYFFVT
jgi:hypothetical protein